MADPRKIVTRFAPSPTGYLHIGGARTALFNWLYARGSSAAEGSQFLLRIEDTDRARHSEDAVAAILDGLSWLGLDWDAEPVSQFERAERHAEVAASLLATGKAYRCWLQGDELEGARDAARESNTRFTSPWRDATDGFPDAPYSVRLKAPLDGETIVKDEVQGDVSFPNHALDDTVILRSDGSPTYNLAVVVDDHDMGVTHVIRGDDHLNNTPKQQHIYEGMGWDVPVFAHVPMIHGDDGKKLSKRHGALGVEAYRDQGFLPEGVRNGLMRLGWASGDEEIIPTARALELFDLGGIGKSPARLDLEKMAATNAHFLHAMAPEAFLDAALPFFEAEPSGDVLDRLKRGAPQLQSRCRLLTDLPAAAAYLTAQRPLTIEGKKAKPLKAETAPAVLEKAATLLGEVADWQPEPIQKTLEEIAASLELGFGKVGPAIRTAVTGGAPSPDLNLTLFALGQDETLGRLADCR